MPMETTLRLQKIGPKAELVCLQLILCFPTVAQVLKAIMEVLPIDHINTMELTQPTTTLKKRILLCGKYRQF